MTKPQEASQEKEAPRITAATLLEQLENLRDAFRTAHSRQPAPNSFYLSAFQNLQDAVSTMASAERLEKARALFVLMPCAILDRCHITALKESGIETIGLGTVTTPAFALPDLAKTYAPHAESRHFFMVADDKKTLSTDWVQGMGRLLAQNPDITFDFILTSANLDRKTQSEILGVIGAAGDRARFHIGFGISAEDRDWIELGVKPLPALVSAMAFREGEIAARQFKTQQAAQPRAGAPTP